MRVRKSVVVLVTAGAVIAAGVAFSHSADAGTGSTKYTHSTGLTQATCTIHANYPKAGVTDWGWSKKQRSATGKAYQVGVRYTFGAYAMVLDYAKKGEPSWGFIARSCLVDRYAYDKNGRRLPDLRAVGGNTETKTVRMSAQHAGKRPRMLLHIGAGEVGTLRNAAKSFVIGNVRAGEPFYITKSRCGKNRPGGWILGYAPESGRWGYVQARHLPACH